MLRLLRFVDQLIDLERTLVDDWMELQLQVTVADRAQANRAAALLGPANPGRRGPAIRFAVDRIGPGVGPVAARRLLRRLDAEGIEGELELASLRKVLPEELRRKETLRQQWARQLSAVPSDWSDMYAEIQLNSTDYLERGALLLAPVNPARYGAGATFRFRCARRFGYGVSPEMAGRCLQRCDDEGITGTVVVLHVLSDTDPVATQGPVWLVGGRNV